MLLAIINPSSRSALYMGLPPSMVGPGAPSAYVCASDGRLVPYLLEHYLYEVSSPVTHVVYPFAE
jgi:hypothetical protein